MKNVCNEMPPRDGTGYLDSFHMFGEAQLFQYKDWILLYCGNLIIPEDELNPFMHVRE